MGSIIRRVLTGTLPSIILGLVLFSGAGAVEQGSSFERSGIHFPGGFDLNTVGTVSGKVSNISRSSASGPVILDLQTTWEKYTVVTCPPWYWDELRITISHDEEVQVTGSKSLGKDGNLYVIAQDIYLTARGKVVTLRNKAGIPHWGSRHGNAGSRQGTGRKNNSTTAADSKKSQ